MWPAQGVAPCPLVWLHPATAVLERLPWLAQSLLLLYGRTDMISSRARLSCGSLLTSRFIVLSAVGCFGRASPSLLHWRMSCHGSVTAGRPPALVRLTLGACVPSFVQVLCL